MRLRLDRGQGGERLEIRLVRAALLRIVREVTGEHLEQYSGASRGELEDADLKQVVPDRVYEVAPAHDTRSRGDMRRHAVVRRLTQVEVAQPSQLERRQALGGGGALVHGPPSARRHPPARSSLDAG